MKHDRGQSLRDSMVKLTNIQLTSKGKLILTTSYDNKFIAQIKTVTGWEYSPKLKSWMIPIYNYVELLRKVSFGDKEKRLIEQVSKDHLRYNNVQITLPELIPPYKFWDFQIDGIKFALKRRNCILSFDYGAGKTLMGLTLGKMCCDAGEIDKCIIICPKTLIPSWVEENVKFFGKEDISVFRKSADNPGIFDKNFPNHQTVNFIILNYQKLTSGRTEHYEKMYTYLPMLEEYCKTHRVMIICDEVTHLKNYKSQIHQNILKLRAARRIGLTGMPLVNKPGELYTLNDWLGNHMFGSYPNFRERYLITDEYGNFIDLRNKEELRSKLEFIMLRKTYKHLLGLPALHIIDKYIQLSKNARDDYEYIMSQFAYEIEAVGEDVLARRNVLAGLMIARMYLCHPETIMQSDSASAAVVKDNLVEKSSDKMAALLELIKEFDYN